MGWLVGLLVFSQLLTWLAYGELREQVRDLRQPPRAVPPRD